MKKIYLSIILFAASLLTAFSAEPQGGVATNSIWSNWYVQAGLDMSLQNPYGYNFAHVFPKGKTLFFIHIFLC